MKKVSPKATNNVKINFKNKALNQEVNKKKLLVLTQP